MLRIGFIVFFIDDFFRMMGRILNYDLRLAFFRVNSTQQLSQTTAASNLIFSAVSTFLHGIYGHSYNSCNGSSHTINRTGSYELRILSTGLSYHAVVLKQIKDSFNCLTGTLKRFIKIVYCAWNLKSRLDYINISAYQGWGGVGLGGPISS